ncbi:MAG: hypothetical protein KAS32_02965 [Candidatus Peribacteraceae bacterium]|nr:hypothetical protein [Candidatus Peribacteraceae bacterium]
MVTILGKEYTNEKAMEFSIGFLKAQPNDKMIDDPASTDETPLPRIHKYTDLEHIELTIRDYGRREYVQGKQMMANDAAEIDDNILG